jgi:hypothetical protein
MTSSSSHITIVTAAIVTVTRMLTDTRGMLQVDPLVREFIQRFERNQAVLREPAYVNLCTLFIRYLLDGGSSAGGSGRAKTSAAAAAATAPTTIPPTLSALAGAVRPLLMIARPGGGLPRHRAAARYDVCMIALCGHETKALAARIAKLVPILEAACDSVAEDKDAAAVAGGGGGDTPLVRGRLVLIYANEADYDDVPSAAHADAMRNRELSARVTLEFFYAAEVQFDRLVNEAVLPHVALDVLLLPACADELARDERQGWKVALREPHNLQKLESAEIIVRWHGFERGQLVRTERNDANRGGRLFEYFQVV